MLEGVKFFEGLSKEELENMSLFCQIKELNAGELLFREGEEANSMYIIKYGKLEVFRGNRKLAELGEDSVIGEMALFGEPHNRMASARALEDSELITILSFSINESIKKHPGLFAKLEELISERRAQNGNI